LATELEDEGLQDGPEEGTDGYDWAIEEIRSIVNTLGAHESPMEKRNGGVRRSLRVFDLINKLVDLIPSDEGLDNEQTL